MQKISIAPALFIPPMPVALVGTVVDGAPNFLTVAWLTRVNFDPPMVAIAVNSGHHSVRGILENKTFSVCLPSSNLLEKTDYCGIVSGARADKSHVFEVFYGELETAPMASEAAICAECALAQTVQLPSNLLFIGNVAAAYASESALTEGKPDGAKLDPLVLTMPDNRYWRLGSPVGVAWHSGRDLKRP